MSWNKKYIDVLGKQIAYVEMGEGDPIIFQHGNPTSSYLWRNILPQLQGLGRCIAMDLIGMGDSEKLEDKGNMTYSYNTHKKYFDGFWSSSLTDSTLFGRPDTEALDISFRLSNIDKIFDVTSKPLIMDIDTGGKLEHLKMKINSIE